MHEFLLVTHWTHPNPRLIGSGGPGGTPAAPEISRHHDRSLPFDLLREASRRLGIMSLLAAVLWTVATVLDTLAWPSKRPTQSLVRPYRYLSGCSSTHGAMIGVWPSFWILASFTW
jgi:hypothetical protein